MLSNRNEMNNEIYNEGKNIVANFNKCAYRIRLANTLLWNWGLKLNTIERHFESTIFRHHQIASTKIKTHDFRQNNDIIHFFLTFFLLLNMHLFQIPCNLWFSKWHMKFELNFSFFIFKNKNRKMSSFFIQWVVVVVIFLVHLMDAVSFFRWFLRCRVRCERT